jgi:hypothetical protein
LQQKIASLEKELEATKGGGSPQNQTETVVQMVCQRLGENFGSCKPNEISQTTHIEQCEGSCLKKSGSLGSRGCSCWPSEDSSPHKEKRGLFKKTKKRNKKKECKTQVVYYAQTENNPFAAPSYRHEQLKLVSDMPRLHEGPMTRSYITEMIQKQYMAVPIVEEYSITSQISSPVCRDDTEHRTGRLCTERKRRDSDLCSCIHGTFHNIDHVNNDIIPTAYNNDNTDFYDSSLYDMVPVKEKPVKIQNYEFETGKIKSPKCDTNAFHFPDRTRRKHRFHPFVVNYSTMPAGPKTINKRETYRKHSPNKVDDLKKFENECTPSHRSSKSCSVDCGNIYIKRILTGGKTQSAIDPIVTVSP